MDKFQNLLKFLKDRNSKFLDIKNNILNSTNEIKKKDFSFSEAKRYSSIYVVLLIFLTSLISGEKKVEKNYIEVGALTCTNDKGKTIYKVSKDQITIVALYSKTMGINKNMIVKGKNDESFNLLTNDKSGFTYSRYISFLKKTYQYRYDFKTNQMFANGKKHQDCVRKSSFVEPAKKIKTNIKMSQIKDPFKHAAKFKWDQGGLACDLNGGSYREFSKKYGELLTLAGKRNIGNGRRDVEIEKISNTKFKIVTKFYSTSQMFRAYGNRHPTAISEKVYTLIAPDTMSTSLYLKTADFKNLNKVAYNSKRENSKTEICD